MGQIDKKQNELKVITSILVLSKMTKQWFVDLYKDYKLAKNEFKHDKKKHIPNLITATRIISIPVIVGLFLTGNFIPAIILSYTAAITDSLDGTLSRKMNAQSEFGRKLDTIADKSLATTLAAVSMVTFPIFIITFLFEAIIGIVNLKADYEKLEAKTSKTGKAKTVYLYATVLFGATALAVPAFGIPAIAGLVATTYMQQKTYKEYQKNYDLQRRRKSMLEFVEIKKRHDRFLDSKKLNRLKGIKLGLELEKAIYHEKENDELINIINDDIKEEIQHETIVEEHQKTLIKQKRR